MSNIIEANNITFRYGGEEESYKVFENLSLQIPSGQFVAVLGHNGSGKSTLAKHFNAVLLPQKGECIIAGMNTNDETKTLDIRKNVGMVFQNPDNQIVATIVEEDVAFGPENLGIPSAEIRTRVDEALADVGMLEYKKHAPHLLSGGQKQRVAIAGIIAIRPRCIVLDEPTAMLDPRGRAEVIEVIKKLCEQHGITIVLITHNMDEAVKADRVVVMDKGEIILDDKPKKVFANVDKLKSIGLSVPQVTELADELRKAGFDLVPDLLSVEEAADAVSWILEQGRAK